VESVTFNLVKYTFNGPDVIDSALAPHATLQLYTRHNFPGIKSLAQTHPHIYTSSPKILTKSNDVRRRAPSTKKYSGKPTSKYHNIIIQPKDMT